MNLLKPAKGYIVSPSIAIVNIAIFVILAAMNLSLSEFSVRSLYYFGANLSNWVDNGQWWRFLTSMFLHLSVMHVLFNCVSLLFAGRFLEPLIGSIPFTALYLITGISGSYASYLFNKGVISAGASGAIFGLFGIFLAILLSNVLKT